MSGLNGLEFVGALLAAPVFAADTTWGFDTSSDYTYDTSKIEVTGGVAKLKNLGGMLKDDAILEYNSSFVAGDTTRGYAGTTAGPDVSLVLETASATLYKASGIFTSRILDGGTGNTWQTINWVSSNPTGTSLQFRVRSGASTSLTSSFVGPTSTDDYYTTSATNLATVGAGFNTTHRYAQYKAYLDASTDSTRTPTVASVALVGTAGAQFDNTKGDFDLGTYSTTNASVVVGRSSFVGLSKMANGGYNTCGTYTSHVFDGGGSVDWDTLSFTFGGTEIDASENGLVGLWHMNNNWPDSKGTNNGTRYGAGTAFSTLARLGSHAGSFNGTDDYVITGNVGSVNSAEFWINDTNATDGVLELINSTAYISVADSAITATGFTSPTIYVNGSSASAGLSIGWNHVAVTTGTAVSSVSMNIGEASGNYVQGLIDEVSIWNRALSATEILDHYKRGAF